MSGFASHDSATKQSQGDGITAEQIADDLASSGQKATDDVAAYALQLGDDSLMLAQRLGWWISRAPEIEEDIALGNIGLDLLGHARFFLTYAGTASGKTEDDLAYFRTEEEFRSALLCELPNGDFGDTIARQLVFSHYSYLLYRALKGSADSTLSAIAAKAEKEVAYHRDHASQWTLRLGDGTDESHRRMQAALDRVWPYIDELFADSDLYARLEGIAVMPPTLREEFDRNIVAVIEAATLQVPQAKPAMHDNRHGAYSEHRGYILAEMQSLARQHPGATW